MARASVLTADIANAMQAQSIRTSGTRTSRRLQTSLIAAQAALTVVLLAAAGASIRTFLHLYETPLGYDPSPTFANLSV
jgi:hypothetical protein